jgi:formylglycine-generating enzyme required for sulfatase activity
MDHRAAGTTYGTAYFIPTENEWCKAAYYDPAKVGGAGYWDYPTRSDTAPTATTVANQLGVAPGSANYNGVVGSPTNVGAYSLKPSTSAYGTFDQGGNIWEWNEALINTARGLRGGSWYYESGYLAASDRYWNLSSVEDAAIGFRVASVPEPGSLAMLLGIALTALLYWRGQRTRGIAFMGQSAV